MPITVTQGAAIANYYTPNAKQRASSQDVIAKLTYSDLWRDAKTLKDNGVMRIDMQGTTASGVKNIQVQVNGVDGSSTVAHALVSPSIQTKDPINQKGAVNKVISALNQSLDSGCSYTVAGSIP